MSIVQYSKQNTSFQELDLLASSDWDPTETCLHLMMEIGLVSETLCSIRKYWTVDKLQKPSNAVEYISVRSL